jgi:hypothetical protein
MRDAEGGSRTGVLPLAFAAPVVRSVSGRKGVEGRDGVCECGRLREEDKVALSTSALPAYIRRMRLAAKSVGRCFRICCFKVEVVAWWGLGIVSSRSGIEAEKRIVRSRRSASESGGFKLSIGNWAEPSRLCDVKSLIHPCEDEVEESLTGTQVRKVL